MNSKLKIKIRLEPLWQQIEVAPGTALQAVLFEHGVEFPCGGRGTCRKCRIKVLRGNLAVNTIQKRAFSAAEIENGWRLACQCQVTEPVTIEVAQMETSILTDTSRITGTYQDSLAVSVDLGTTTLVAQLLDMQTGEVIGVESALNSQARHGADIMSRVQFGLTDDGAQILQNLIRVQISQMISNLLKDCKCPQRPLQRINIVGNTVMHHLFGGLSVEPLARVPFETTQGDELNWRSADIGWHLSGNPAVRFLPCPGGFVGSDILAGILAVGMHLSPETVALIDLGTNGEVVVGNRDRILCASTAAGPAFEGAQISMGMRATTGAVWKINSIDGQLKSDVIGNVPARGICGSGLVDAVAAGLTLGWINPSGRITLPAREIVVQSPVVINQADIRELQLAKGAIAAGLQILLTQAGLRTSDLKRIYLAGAFGNYINVESARRIGLLDFPADMIEQAGNTALRGAKMSLSDGYHEILSITQHIPLATNTRFHEIFAEQMTFPE